MSTLASLPKLQRRDPMLRLRYDAELAVVRDLRGNLAEVKASTAKGVQSAGQRFLKAHSDLFGGAAGTSLKALEQAPDPHGGTSLTLQQYHGAYPVYGGSVRFHVNKSGVLDTINNRLFPDLAKVPRKPRVSESKAIEAARRRTKCRSAPERQPELLVYRHEGKAYLAWQIHLRDTRAGERGAPAEWIVYVDAATGKVLLYYDNVQTAGPAVGSGTGQYSGAVAISSWFTDTTYQLRDTTRTATGGPEIITNDDDGASPSEDADNNWNDLSTMPRHQNQGAEVDAHRFAGNVADYFRTVHGRNSFDGAGANLITIVHHSNNYNNGFWSPADNRVRLGDGSGAAPGDNYECTDDWLAHEFTHGYTQFTCGLQYLNESGALNEAFSDIFAAFITGDWLVFEDSWLKASAPASRNMVDPTNGGNWNLADPITSVLAGHQPSHYSVPLHRSGRQRRRSYQQRHHQQLVLSPDRRWDAHGERHHGRRHRPER